MAYPRADAHWAAQLPHSRPWQPHSDAPFERLGRLATRVLDAPLVFVGVVGEAAPFLSCRPGSVVQGSTEQETAAGIAFAQALAESGTSVAITDIRDGDETSGDLWLHAMGIRALAAFPMCGPRGELLGTLCAADLVPREWTKEDLETLAVLADLAASKVILRGEARRSGEMAALLQHSMLTELPEIVGLALEARYLPAQDTAQIGGDWYDAFVLPDGVPALVVGDVAGHDMLAAAKMGQLRNLLRAIACHTNEAPHSVLSALDTTAYGLGVTDLATVIYARVEQSGPSGCQVRWANAGHPPPLLIRAGAQARYLDQPSGVLLAFGDGVHTDGVVDLPLGTTLLFYTDGLVETRHMDIGGGLDRLREAATATAEMPLAVLCDHLLGRLAYGTNEDDVTLLAVRRAERD